MVPRLRYSLRATRLLSSAGRWGLIVGAEMFFRLRSGRLNERQFINSPDGVPNRREHLLQLHR
jgi:hypothetical protein